jgi:SNF2 family DNA or RNA helicase
VHFDSHRGVFVDPDGRTMLAGDLLEHEVQLSDRFPELELSPTFWDVNFKYVLVDDRDAPLEIRIVLRNKSRSYEIVPPSSLVADYFVANGVVVPVRSHDFRSLSNFLPTLEHDGIVGMSIRELMNFDFFASTHGFSIENSELKDRILADPRMSPSEVGNLLSVDPYPYQAIGIEWLRSQQSLGRSGVILGDVMGLGKTLQAIGLLADNVRDGLVNNLVVCPGTLVENWCRELRKFAPNIRVCVHFGPHRSGTSSKISGYDVVVTSYDTVVRDASLLTGIQWNVVVLDEAQAIKNPDAKRALKCKELPREFGVAISGTPLENRLLDLWSLSDFCDSSLFPSRAKFENDYENNSHGAAEAGKLLRPILLRRRLSDIDHQLPDKVVIDHPLVWPSELNEIYEEVRIEAIREFSMSGGLVATGRLRKLTTHPIMMEIELDEMNDLSPKYSALLDIIDELFANDEKCLVFASYTHMIDRMADDLSWRYPRSFIERLDGRTPMKSRSDLVDRFNSAPNSGVLICNPTVAGAGLNITGANHVIHYNLEWNPAKEDQATFRVYRNGQLKETFIHRLFYIDTIDEVIDQRIHTKRSLSDLSVDGGVLEEDYWAGLHVSPIKDGHG